MNLTTLGLLGSFIAVLVIKMLFLSYYGYKDGNFNSISINQLLLEVGVIGFINILPSLIEPTLFNEQFSSKTFLTAGLMGSAAIGFHVMSQGVGLYNGFNK